MSVFDNHVAILPSSYVHGEPMVWYVTDNAQFSIPRRSIENVPDCFLAGQLRHAQSDTIQLTGSEFQNRQVLSMILDYLNRRLDMGTNATLRLAHHVLSPDDWKCLCDAEMFVFHKCDRTPFWNGLIYGVDLQMSRGAADFRVSPDRVEVFGSDGFFLGVTIDRDAPMPLDIPSEAITCIYGGESVRCTGVLHARGYLRVKPVANSGLWWFDCAVSRVPEIDCDLVYK
jgi:hypothetical protein